VGWLEGKNRLWSYSTRRRVEEGKGREVERKKKSFLRPGVFNFQALENFLGNRAGWPGGGPRRYPGKQVTAGRLDRPRADPPKKWRKRFGEQPKEFEYVAAGGKGGRPGKAGIPPRAQGPKLMKTGVKTIDRRADTAGGPALLLGVHFHQGWVYGGGPVGPRPFFTDFSHPRTVGGTVFAGGKLGGVSFQGFPTTLSHFPWKRAGCLQDLFRWAISVLPRPLPQTA